MKDIYWRLRIKLLPITVPAYIWYIRHFDPAALRRLDRIADAMVQN